MANARPMNAAQEFLYAFVAEEDLDSDLERWVERRVVESGDSVSVLSTFYRNRLARVDVVYPPSARSERCPLCAALLRKFGTMTIADTSGMIRRLTWRKWDCCEVRVADARIAQAVSYVSRPLWARRNSSRDESLVLKGDALLK